MTAPGRNRSVEVAALRLDPPSRTDPQAVPMPAPPPSRAVTDRSAPPSLAAVPAPVASFPSLPARVFTMKDLLANPITVLLPVQRELIGSSAPSSLHMRVSEDLQDRLTAWCERERVQKRTVVEAVLRAFLTEQGL